MLPGDDGEIGAIIDLLIEIANGCFRLGFRHGFRGAYQDVTDFRLLDELCFITAAAIHHHHQVEATAVPEYRGDGSGFKIRDHIGHQ